jgi:hypothetical protein
VAGCVVGPRHLQNLLAGLSFLARKRHPLADDGAPHLWLGHLDSLSRSRRNAPWSEDPRVVQLFRSPDGALRRLLGRIGLRSSRQKRATAFMHGAAHDNEAAFRHRGAKAFARRWFLCVNPNHQHSARVEEIHQPVHRRLKRVKRASPPIHKRNVVLTGWTAAIARRCRQQISAPVQLQHQFHALRASHHDALARRAACERDHRINNSVAGGNLRGRHNITCFVRSSAADRGRMEIDRLRSGKASVLSITPFAGLQTACHARLHSRGPISSGRDLISRALPPRFYMSRIRSVVRHGLRHQLHPDHAAFVLDLDGNKR